jgi:hypothetical protein
MREKAIGRLGACQLGIDEGAAVRFGRVHRLEQAGVFVGRTGSRQRPRRVDVALQLRANGRVREIGHALERGMALAHIEELLELPDHVPGGGNARRGRGACPEKPHEIGCPKRITPGKIVHPKFRRVAPRGHRLDAPVSFENIDSIIIHAPVVARRAWSGGRPDPSLWRPVRLRSRPNPRFDTDQRGLERLWRAARSGSAAKVRYGDGTEA